MSLSFGHIEIPVTDPQRSLRFYRDVLGFGVEQVQGERYVWLTSGAVTVLLHPDLRPGDTEANLVLYTHTLDDEVARLRAAGVSLTREGTCVSFADPDGNRFQLVDPGDDHSGG
ncbi:MAG: VOC family protein [Myxococcales bacterium]|nr:VOC family protein [Myxococcales bacterium]